MDYRLRQEGKLTLLHEVKLCQGVCWVDRYEKYQHLIKRGGNHVWIPACWGRISSATYTRSFTAYTEKLDQALTMFRAVLEKKHYPLRT